MKEKCEKLFKKGKIGYTAFAILIIVLSVAVPIIVISVGAKLKISTVAELVFADILVVIACIIYKKSAYYVETEGEKAFFYTDKGIVEKNTADLKKAIRTASEIFLFFNDKKMRLCKFRKCPEVTQCISKENFPNL